MGAKHGWRLLPRTRLLASPTPIEFLRRLSEMSGSVKIFIKRDDYAGGSSGGNKVRKLEYLFGEALANKSDTIVTSGAIQSNHVRQTAAMAAKLGIACHAILERRLVAPGPEYNHSGNILLNKLFGASIHVLDDPRDYGVVADQLIEDLKRAGKSPYIVPAGGSSVLGALGYVSCAEEIRAQENDLGIKFGSIYHASNSGGTQAGLVAGMQSLGDATRVVGVSVRNDRDTQIDIVYPLARAVAAAIGLEGVAENTISVDDDYIGPGYGKIEAATWQTVHKVARLEGIVLDPVYTAKAMTCLLAHIETGAIAAGTNVLFIHTGGVPAIFAYASGLEAALLEEEIRDEDLGLLT